MNSSGTVQFDTVYSHTPNIEMHTHIVSTDDGGVIIAATSWSYPADDYDNEVDVLVWKINPFGEIEWQKVIATYWMKSMIPTSDGNYLILSYHLSNSMDILLTKIDSDGNTIWRSIIGETWYNGTKLTDWPGMVAEIDKKIYLTTQERSAGVPGLAGAIYQLDENGNIKWKSRIEKEFELDKLNLLKPFRFNEKYYCQERWGDRVYRFDPETGDYWNITDSIRLDFTNFVHAPCGYEDEITAIIESPDGIVLNKYKQLDTAYYSKSMESFAYTSIEIIRSAEGGYIALNFLPEPDYIWIVSKMDCMGNLDYWSDECNSKIEEDSQILLYPNPAQNIINIEATFDFDSVMIYNTLGSYVILENSCKCNRQIIDLSNFAAGVYYVKILGETDEAISKFVKY